MDKAPQGHTPGKWRASECRSTCNVNILETGKRDGVVIGIMNRSTAVENRANAQFVVTACNSFYELLEACRVAVYEYEMKRDLMPQLIPSPAVQAAMRAVKKAEGKE